LAFTYVNELQVKVGAVEEMSMAAEEHLGMVAEDRGKYGVK
jgi:hypothetical protein